MTHVLLESLINNKSALYADVKVVCNLLFSWSYNELE